MRKIAIVLVVITALFSFTTDQTTPPQQKTIRVLIDAGHGGLDHGAQSNYLNEKDLTLAISNKIKELGSNKNIKLVFTRSTDEFLQLSQRIELLETAPADLLISLHVSSSSNTATSGLEIYYPSSGEFTQRSKEFGFAISQSFSENKIQLHHLKMEPANFFVLKNANCPSVLLELGFLSNENDQMYLNNEDNQEIIAEAIIQSIETLVP